MAMQYTRPTTTKEAEKLVWVARKADSRTAQQNAAATLLASRDSNGFIKIYDDSERSYCLFKIYEDSRGLAGKVASSLYDFSKSENMDEVRRVLAPYSQDKELQDYISYFLQ
jgi:hypothetical protein